MTEYKYNFKVLFFDFHGKVYGKGAFAVITVLVALSAVFNLAIAAAGIVWSANTMLDAGRLEFLPTVVALLAASLAFSNGK